MAKLNAAESIRGLACVAVVLSHLSLGFYPYLHHFAPKDSIHGTWNYTLHHSPFAFLYSGTAAVFVFFVLSGYILSYVILKNKNRPKKILEMAVKRYPRLAIPAFLSCVIIWLVFLFTNVDSHLVSGWLQAYAQEDIPFTQAVYEGSIGAFLFAQSATNWVLWTMQIEFLGSLFLFILLLIYHYKPALFLLASVALLVPFFFVAEENFSLGMLSFVIGCYIYLYARQLPTLVGVSILILGLYLAGVHNSSHAYHWLYHILGWRTYEYGNFIAGILIVYSVLLTTKISDVLDQPILVALGKLSFSIYLLHMVLIYLVCIPLFNLLIHLGWFYDASVAVATLFCLIVLLGVAKIYSRYVDDFAVKCSNALADRLIKKERSDSK
ncbi:acyltransferase family protein [Acinetobacter boissieri]|uniref:Peptidoglycan/LPS O-acetylase OafA/YrhL, contains acyltransferase and SGNH-hydrolase domains n=1 Tax=Acinetobacter boissieri TaxID=1219383 RepID=A0A1G6H6V6_9GAMM|nr:acyltransferase [Acinetobacter boissieri]SDB89665.1 Peptidoglycan/LPS O-acetylase OafA/YrhL, contains acyltransferase and SGNH-hydrolase domains [Acinetobacter boissieri]